MRLIDADALLSKLNNLEPRCSNKYVKQGLDDGLHYYMPKLLEEQPTIDAVPVVRCKDCARCVIHKGIPLCNKWRTFPEVSLEDFCSYGEKRGDLNG